MVYGSSRDGLTVRRFVLNTATFIDRQHGSYKYCTHNCVMRCKEIMRFDYSWSSGNYASTRCSTIQSTTTRFSYSGWIRFSLTKKCLISRTTTSSLWAWFGLAPASKSVWAIPVLPCLTALERGVSPQHPLRLGSAPALEHGSIRDIFSLESFNWRLHDPMYVLDVFKKGGKLKADILRDKMNCTVRFESSFLRVPLMYQPLLPCAN